MNQGSPSQRAVDTESAHELLKEATKLISSSELELMGEELEAKVAWFQRRLASDALADLTLEHLDDLAGLMFTVRSRRAKLLAGLEIEAHQDAIGDLLYGDGAVPDRFERFVDTYGFLGPHPHRARTWASELLHFNDPERHWLWTSWVWEPASGKGALRLVSELDLYGSSHAEIYQRVGEATAALAMDGRSEGYTRLGRGLLGTDVFLASVASISMFTIYKHRISQEFLRFLPEFQETTRRLLGVQHLVRES